MNPEEMDIGYGHILCANCGLCVDCGDCDKLGCGKLSLFEKAADLVILEDKKLLEELGKK